VERLGHLLSLLLRLGPQPVSLVAAPPGLILTLVLVVTARRLGVVRGRGLLPLTSACGDLLRGLRLGRLLFLGLRPAIGRKKGSEEEEEEEEENVNSCAHSSPPDTSQPSHQLPPRTEREQRKKEREGKGEGTHSVSFFSGVPKQFPIFYKEGGRGERSIEA